jgi:hypothetical protein
MGVWQEKQERGRHESQRVASGVAGNVGVSAAAADTTAKGAGASAPVSVGATNLAVSPGYEFRIVPMTARRVGARLMVETPDGVFWVGRVLGDGGTVELVSDSSAVVREVTGKRVVYAAM